MTGPVELDWRGWALDMCSLLDRIEVVRDDPRLVHKLCQGRFDMARKRGLIVEMTGLASGMDQ